MSDKKLLKTGIAGTASFVACPFIPFLVIARGAVGLSARRGWPDYVLLPALAVFVTLTGDALCKRKQTG